MVTVRFRSGIESGRRREIGNTILEGRYAERVYCTCRNSVTIHQRDVLGKLFELLKNLILFLWAAGQHQAHCFYTQG